MAQKSRIYSLHKRRKRAHKTKLWDAILGDAFSERLQQNLIMADCERTSRHHNSSNDKTFKDIGEDGDRLKSGVLSLKHFMDGNMTSEEVESDHGANGTCNEEEDDYDKHTKMLAGITGMPGEAFQVSRRKSNTPSNTEPQNNLNYEELDGTITIQDLLDPLYGKPGYSKLRKNLLQLEKGSLALQAPLPKQDRVKLERKVAYAHTKKDITKWEPLVKRNREASTIFFDDDTDVGYSTVGAIASKFEPRTDLEKKITSLVRDPDVMEAYEKDGAMLLELNRVSVEDMEEHRNRLTKMRNLLFRHEMRAKRIKKIKSKTFHRILKRDKLKSAAALVEMDPEAAKKLAMKQEFKRAEERMTLKHRNSSRWAKRIVKRGLKTQDEGTRAAISEQLHLNTLLTRKMSRMNESSTTSESDQDEDAFSSASDGERMSKLLNRAKERTLEAMDEEEEMPKSGVLSLPFMIRGLKKRKAAAEEEAQLALQEYESTMKQLTGNEREGTQKLAAPCGKRVFGRTKSSQMEVAFNQKIRSSSDSEEIGVNEKIHFPQKENTVVQDVQVDPRVIFDDCDADGDVLFRSFEDAARSPGSKTSNVSIFGLNSSHEIKSQNLAGSNGLSSSAAGLTVSPPQHQDELYSDSESQEVIVDGALSTGMECDYKLPSQAELLREAFAGDDVEGEFAKEKLDIVNQENPEPEKPLMLPGWGQWTHIQQKRGLPSWMVEEHEKAKKKRDDELRKRKDANLKHVIILEKVDKKAEKLQLKAPPFPYTSSDIFEQSIRMPLGPEFNPTMSASALNRPAVVKQSGVIIKPVQFEDVDPCEKVNIEKGTRDPVMKKKGQHRKKAKEL